jgi:dipeptidyl aminopeptidase/acylaminoacyl peptidase
MWGTSNIRSAFFSVLLGIILIAYPSYAQAPVASATAPVSLIPTAMFASDAETLHPVISPNGQQMVYRRQVGGKTYLAWGEVGSLVSKIAEIPGKTDLIWYRWAGNDRFIFAVSTNVTFEGEEVKRTWLLSFEPAKNLTQLIGFKDQGFEGDDMLCADPDGKFLLLQIQRTIFEYPSVFRFELSTGKGKRIVDQRTDVWEYYADDTCVVRMGIGSSNRKTVYYYRKNETDTLKIIGKVKEDDEDGLMDVAHIVSGSDDGYVLSNKKTGRFALYKTNYITRELGEMVYGSDTNDITDYTLTEDGKAVRSVRYTDDRDRIIWFDPVMKKHQSKLDKALPGEEVWIQSQSRDSGKMIVYSTSSTDPGSYYLFEPAAGSLRRFAGVNDALDTRLLTKTNYVQYKARDGLAIPAYLTLPKGRAAKGLPLIILPHGGPYGVRDTPDFNSEVQVLANRGYAVLQPNFRGSESYGMKFYESGLGQIGRAMQDDLDDGMDWLAKDGIIDPKRVCVVGSSYGGYAALWAVARNPERYRCAASFAGVTDWKSQLKYDRRFFSNRHAKKWEEKVTGESEFDLDTVSPMRLASSLSRPVLITHGDNDSNVPYSQFTKYLAAMKKAGKTVDSWTYKDEGHGFNNRLNEKDWYDRLTKFLNEHNPPD